jgi:hypothetical protein
VSDESLPESFFEVSQSRVGILEPEIFLYDVSAGGVFEYRDDWSRGASGLAARSAAFSLKRIGGRPLIIPDPGRALDFFRLKTRMRYHCTAFQGDFFAGRRPAFRAGAGGSLVYSLGALDSLCDRYGVDAFLYMYGFEENFSEERRRFLGGGAGKGRKGAVPAERTFVAAVLVERDGRVSWYKHLLVSGDLDMRNPEHSSRVVEALFE